MRPNSPTVTVLNLFETHHFFLAWQVKAPLSLLCISCQFHLQVLLCELSYTLPKAHQSAPVTTKEIVSGLTSFQGTVRRTTTTILRVLSVCQI